MRTKVLILVCVFSVLAPVLWAGEPDKDEIVAYLTHLINGRIDPSFVVTHRLPLSQAPYAYEIFAKKKDGCIKVVLDPAA